MTKLGKKVASTKVGEDEEFKVLSYIQQNRTATEDELDVVGGRYLVKKLAREGLVKELTS